MISRFRDIEGQDPIGNIFQLYTKQREFTAELKEWQEHTRELRSAVQQVLDWQKGANVLASLPAQVEKLQKEMAAVKSHLDSLHENCDHFFDQQHKEKADRDAQLEAEVQKIRGAHAR